MPITCARMFDGLKIPGAIISVIGLARHHHDRPLYFRALRPLQDRVAGEAACRARIYQRHPQVSAPPPYPPQKLEDFSAATRGGRAILSRTKDSDESIFLDWLGRLAWAQNAVSRRWCGLICSRPMAGGWSGPRGLIIAAGPIHDLGNEGNIPFEAILEGWSKAAQLPGGSHRLQPPEVSSRHPAEGLLGTLLEACLRFRFAGRGHPPNTVCAGSCRSRARGGDTPSPARWIDEVARINSYARAWFFPGLAPPGAAAAREIARSRARVHAADRGAAPTEELQSPLK